MHWINSLLIANLLQLSTAGGRRPGHAVPWVTFPSPASQAWVCKQMTLDTSQGTASRLTRNQEVKGRVRELCFWLASKRCCHWFFFFRSQGWKGVDFPECRFLYICPSIQCSILSMIETERKSIFIYAHFLLVDSHSLSSVVGGPERWFGGYKYLVLLERTQLQFSATTWWLRTVHNPSS